VSISDFYTQTLCPSPYFNAVTQLRSLALLEPVTRAAVLSIISDAHARGAIFEITETFRSVTRQEQLYAAGLTTIPKIGTHHFGLACDFVRLAVNGDCDWNTKDYALLGELAAKHGLLWGGTWTSFPDHTHVQRCSLADQDRLFNLSWYPDAHYVC
jgi:hypothetical protein